MNKRKKNESVFNKLINRLKWCFGTFILKAKGQKPIAIVMVDGGFGSTIVKYALGICIKKKLGLKVKYDLSWFDDSPMDCDNKFKRTFELLNVFPNLDFEIATKDEICFYKKYFNFTNIYPYKYNEALFLHKRPIYANGYYENWKYFDFVKEDLFKKLDFSPIKLGEQNMTFLNAINLEPASVAVHVRRGDYVNLGLCLLTENYYLSAINKIMQKKFTTKPHFFFFSNGMDWVKENITSKLSAEILYSFVEINDNDTGYIDLYLISECKHQISSNSSFGFLGGFLNKNKNKIVIIPEKWIPNESPSTVDSELAHRMPGFITLPCDKN